MGNRDININKKESRIINGAFNILNKNEFKSLSKNQAFKQYNDIVETASLINELAENAYQKLNDSQIELEEAIEDNHVLKIEKIGITKKYNSALEDIKELELLRESALEEVDKLTKDLNNSNDENLELKNNLNNIKKDLRDAESQKCTLESQAEKLQVELAESGIKIKELGNQIRVLHEEKNELQKENDDQAHRITGLVKNNRAYDKKIDDLKLDIENKEVLINKLQTDKIGFKERLDRTQNNLIKQKEQTQELTNTIVEQTEEIQVLGKKIEERDKKLNNLQIEVQEGLGSLDAFKQVIDEHINKENEKTSAIKESINECDIKINGNKNNISLLKVMRQDAVNEQKRLKAEIVNGNNVEENKLSLEFVEKQISNFDKQIIGVNTVVRKTTETRNNNTKSVANIENNIGEVKAAFKTLCDNGVFSS